MKKDFVRKKLLAFLATILCVGVIPTYAFSSVYATDELIDSNSLSTEDSTVILDEDMNSDSPDNNVEDIDGEQNDILGDDNQENESDENVDENNQEEGDQETDENKLTPISNISSKTTIYGIIINWPKDNSAKGYAIFKQKTDNNWELIKKTTNTTYTDMAPSISAVSHMSTGANTYAVAPYYNKMASYEIDGELATDNSVTGAWVLQPAKVTASKSKKTLKVSWKSVNGATGYRIEYSTSPLFNNAKSKVISVSKSANKGTLKRSYTVKAKKKYYVRVKAYINGESIAKAKVKGKVYSEWTSSLGNKFSVKLSSKKFISKNIYKLASENPTYGGYSVVQGGCQYGKYLYLAINKRTSKNYERTKILKIRVSNGKIVKKSGALSLGHANSMTYNTKTKQLVSANCTMNDKSSKKITIVNPKTMKVVKTITPTVPTNVYRVNCSEKALSNIEGYSAISYNKSDNTYTAIVKGNSGLVVIFNYKFVATTVIKLSKIKGSNYYYQDMLVTDDYILSCQSGNVNKSSTYSSNKNIIAVYTRTGAYLGEVVTKGRYEIENVILCNGKYYIAYHTSHYATKYKWDYLKKVEKTKENYKKYNNNNYKTKVDKSNNSEIEYYKVYKKNSFKVFERIGKVCIAGT